MDLSDLGKIHLDVTVYEAKSYQGGVDGKCGCCRHSIVEGLDAS